MAYAQEYVDVKCPECGRVISQLPRSFGITTARCELCLRVAQGLPLPSKEQYAPEDDLAADVARMMGEHAFLAVRKKRRRSFILVPQHLFKTPRETLRKVGTKLKEAVTPKSQQIAAEKRRGPLF